MLCCLINIDFRVYLLLKYGTLVASLASLITFQEYTRRVPNGGKRFLFLFSGISFAFLAILLAAMSVVMG